MGNNGVMRWIGSVLIAAVSATPACGHAVSPTPTTGLTGVVVRGPIVPVCQVSEPCDAPFSAGFTVHQDGRRVAQFQSDAAGRFTIWLRPGTYSVIPNPDAPLIAPTSQVKTVEVRDTGLTDVRLEFDTGIR
jgi:hypothetical protein